MSFDVYLIAFKDGEMAPADAEGVRRVLARTRRYQPDVPGFLDAESFGYAAGEAYRSVGGDPDAYQWRPCGRDEPAGENFDFDNDDEQRKRFPCLLDRFISRGRVVGPIYGPGDLI